MFFRARTSRVVKHLVAKAGKGPVVVWTHPRWQKLVREPAGARLIDAAQTSLGECVKTLGSNATVITVGFGDAGERSRELLCAGLTDVRQKSVSGIVISAATWRG